MQNHTVLLVDDEPTNLKMMERQLMNIFRTVTVSSGEEALEVLKCEEVSMLITDQRMSGMSGTELVRRVRLNDPDIICLLVTSSRDTSTFIDAMINSGAVGVINKPWNPAGFMETVLDAIKRYENRLVTKRSLKKLKGAIDALDKIAHS
jgi:response regulator RpfG family c-di-GMP phosphodiesterase